MPQAPRQLTPTASGRDFFGAELRHWRQQRGLSQDSLGARIHVSGDLVAKVEKALRWPPGGFAERSDAVLETGGVLTRLMSLVEHERRRAGNAWPLGDVDNDVDTSPSLVARGDAVEMMRSGDCGQAEGSPPRTETLVRVRVAGQEVLVPVSAEGLVLGTLDVASTPSGSDVAGFDPALLTHWDSLLRVLVATHNVLSARQLREVVSRELTVIRGYRSRALGRYAAGLLSVEAKWAEFASWTSEDLGEWADAARWLEVAYSLADEANDGPMTAYVVMRQAQQALAVGESSSVISLAEAAQRCPGLADRDRALSFVRQAQGHALAGDVARSAASMARAYRLVAHAEDHDEQPGTIGGHCTSFYLTAHEGHCQLLAGRAEQAVATLEGVLDDWPPMYRRDEALARARLALAYAACRRRDEAESEGVRAQRLAVETSSMSALRTIGRLKDLSQARPPASREAQSHHGRH